jgi:alpha-1,3-rhamnosyl/mannosyltransferase
MNIAFDATHHLGFTGINVYMKNLVASLARRFTDDQYTLLTTFNKQHKMLAEFPEQDRALFKTDNPFPNSLALGHIGVPLVYLYYRYLYGKQSHKYDLIHFTNPFHFEPIHNAVVTLHDMIPLYKELELERRHERDFRRRIRIVERSNAHIFVPSNFVRDELLANFTFDPNRITVTYEAAGADFMPIAPEECDLERFGLSADDKYFLYVGRIDKRKNIERLVQAYLSLPSSITDHLKLVLIANGAATHVKQFREKHLRHHNIIHLTGIKNADLAKLLSRAMGLAFVSLNEGFGIPILEAMQCGCPVLTSDVSSMPEVAGDAAILVDPYRVDTIANGLQTLASDEALRERLRHDGLARAKEFSWDRCAIETHRGYEKAYHGGVA